jgi:hypothetical protein
VDDCSTVGLGISSVFDGLGVVSVAGFFFGGFLRVTGSVFHESGLIKPSRLIEFETMIKRK